MGAGLLRRPFVAIRAVLAGEKLDELPESSGARPRTSLLGVLTARETLPEDAPLSKDGEAFLSWLFRPEVLPLDPPRPRSGRQSFLGMLFLRERLPEDRARSGRTRGGAA